MLAVTFMWEPTDIVALNFLPRIFKSSKEKVLSQHPLNQWKLNGNLQNNTVILFQEKLFAKTLVSHILKIKTIFVSPDEHEY